MYEPSTVSELLTQDVSMHKKTVDFYATLPFFAKCSHLRKALLQSFMKKIAEKSLQNYNIEFGHVYVHKHQSSEQEWRSY